MSVLLVVVNSIHHGSFGLASREVGLINEQLETLRGLGHRDALSEAGLTSGYSIFLSSLTSRCWVAEKRNSK